MHQQSDLQRGLYRVFSSAMELIILDVGNCQLPTANCQQPLMLSHPPVESFEEQHERASRGRPSIYSCKGAQRIRADVLLSCSWAKRPEGQIS